MMTMAMVMASSKAGSKAGSEVGVGQKLASHTAAPRWTSDTLRLQGDNAPHAGADRGGNGRG